MGCSKPKPPIQVYIDSSFEEVQLKAIYLSLKFWESKTDLRFTPEVKLFPEYKHMKSAISIYNAKQGWQKDRFKEITKNKETDPDYMVIATTTMNREIYIGGSFHARTILFKTVIHEMGHVFGCSHSDNQFDIMYRYISNDHQIVSKECLRIIRWTY
jgi:hypothetical protein